MTAKIATPLCPSKSLFFLSLIVYFLKIPPKKPPSTTNNLFTLQASIVSIRLLIEQSAEMLSEF